MLQRLLHLVRDHATRCRRGRGDLGERGEAIAEAHLRKLGYKLVARNWSCREGELDLIMRDGDVLVFVEVKTRRGGRPEDAVNVGKRRKLIAAAKRFLHEHPATAHRFDVVAVVVADATTVRHHRNAF